MGDLLAYDIYEFNTNSKIQVTTNSLSNSVKATIAMKVVEKATGALTNGYDI